MDQNRSWIARVLLILTAAVILVGCQAATRDIPGSGSVTDPCADRLHELAGSLLHYYSRHGALPENLHGLQGMAGRGTLPAPVCPVSGDPYIYRKNGVRLEDHVGKLVLYDAVPAHAGMRLGVVLTTPKESGTMIAHVLLFAGEPILDPQ